jgi:hypothetical protein
MKQVIEVTVSTDGKVTVQTKGFTGSVCKAASEALEKALGLKAIRETDCRVYTHSRPISSSSRRARHEPDQATCAAICAG